MASISRKRVTESVEDDYSPTMVDDNDDEVEAALSRPKRSRFSSGWGEPKQERTERVQAPYLKLAKNGKRIIKLMTGEPSLRYFEHFVNSSGNRYICPGRDVCALCAAGHRASYRYMMNVVDMEDPKTVCTWTFGNEVSQQLQAFAEETVTSPIDRDNLYFQVYHIVVEGRKAPGTKVLPMKARDIQEDYGVEPLNEKELAELKEGLYGEETLWIWSNVKIAEAAENLTPKDLPSK